MIIGDFLSRLDRVRPSGDGYTARCPAHQDNEPSLSVSAGSDARILINCHAGCETASVIAAVGLTMADLFAGDAVATTKREVARYDYTDADGRLLYQIVRYFPKDFRARRPDGSGGWIWNRKGVHPTIYRLPSVLNAASKHDRVFIVEGEQDVEALERLGMVATCNPGGAGKWISTFSQALAGANVVILPDADDAGRKHAEDIARSTVGEAQEVRIVDLPGLDNKGDVSRWIELGGTRDKLISLVEACLIYEPSAASESEGVHVDAKTPTFSETALKILPSMLQRGLSLFQHEARERDVFLTGALATLSGCLPNVIGRYGPFGKQYKPHLMTVILAHAGGGKGAMLWGGRYGNAIQKRLIEESKRAHDDWKVQAEAYDESKRNRKWNDADTHAPPPGPEPIESRLFVPGNTSARALLDNLEATGSGIMIEPEIDAVSSSMNQEWGQFDYILRQSWEHETLDLARKGLSYRIENPSLAVALSGTSGQFHKFVDGIENGLFSRILFYTYTPDPSWHDVRPRRLRYSPESMFDELASQVNDLHIMLSQRDSPLSVELGDRHWDAINGFSEFNDWGYELYGPEWLAIARRIAVNCFRLIMTLAVVNAYERGAELSSVRKLQATDEDVSAAVLLTGTYAEHVKILFDRLYRAPVGSRQMRRKQRLFENLPSTFGRNDLKAEAETVGVSERTAFRYLNGWQDEGLVTSRHGEHVKVAN